MVDSTDLAQVLHEAHDIARRAAAAGAFAAVPLVMRYCPMIATIREIAAGEAIQYLSFKFVGGMVDRYHQQRVEWVIDRSISGGGPLLNLGIHHVDLNACTGCSRLARSAGHVAASREVRHTAPIARATSTTVSAG